MRRTDHDEFEGMAAGWALHALEPAEEQVFTEHLATCDRCQRLVRDSEEVLGNLAYDVPLFDPPPQVLDRIREATGATDAMAADSLRVEHRDSPVVVLPRRVPRRPSRWLIAATAAGLVLIALLGWNVVLQNRVDEAERIAAQRQEVITQLAQNTTGTILTDPTNRTVGYVVRRASTIEIVAAGLAPNDRARSTYVLWAVQGSGEPPRAIGTFDIVSTAMHVRVVGGSLPHPDSLRGFAVSKEVGRGVPERPSQVVATGAVAS